MNMSFQGPLERVHPGCSNFPPEMTSDIDDLRNDLYAFEGVELRETPLLRKNCAVETAFFSALEVAHNLDVGKGGTLERLDCQQQAMQTDTVES